MNILYPGSFNPIHDGHKYVHNQIQLLFPNSNIHMVSFQNPSKPTNQNTLYHYSGTIDEYCKNHNIDIIVRGMRTHLDPKEDSEWLDYVLSKTNCTVIYVKSPKHLEQLSSSTIREPL